MIAISYRRSDSISTAGRLNDRLRLEFGAENVFMDFDSIPYGADFRRHIDETIQSANVVVAIMGTNWTGPRTGGRRIDDEGDFVRLEIASALKHEVPIIPVLLDDATMPDERGLPETISALAYRNALHLDTGVDFHHHAARLISAIRKLRSDTRGNRRRDVASHNIVAQKALRAGVPVVFWRRARSMWIVFAIGGATLVVGMLFFFWRLNTFQERMTPVAPTSNGEEKRTAELPTPDIESFRKSGLTPLSPPTNPTSAPELTPPIRGWNTYLNVSKNLPSSL